MLNQLVMMITEFIKEGDYHLADEALNVWWSSANVHCILQR